jgi:hypothetical protein
MYTYTELTRRALSADIAEIRPAATDKIIARRDLGALA